MKAFFGSNARYEIRKRGFRHLLFLDVEESRKAQARWSTGIWMRAARYANGFKPDNKDAENIVALLYDLGWSPHRELSSGTERQRLVSDIIREAQEVRTQVGEVLRWIANPGENVERDRRAVQLISEHSHGIRLQLIDGRLVGRSFGAEHFLDIISRLVNDTLQQIGKDLACLPVQSPIRTCKTQSCRRFFARERKHLHCEKHRGARASRSTEENRRYKYIRDNLRIPVSKLEKKVRSGRVQLGRDGAWKLKCLIQIHIDRSNRIKKRPTDYLPVS